MKLSIYVGLRAIAYILTQGSEIVKHGIKRVNISFDNYYEFIAGLPVSKRINRRMKAQARRNLWRYKSRRNNLKKLLFKAFGFESQHLPRTKNLQLRVEGTRRKLTPQELTNVLMQLQIKRGYKSMRGVSDNENSDYLKEIERHETNIKSYPSLAAYLLTLDSSTNIIVTRQTYINEFNDIMDVQQIDEALRKKIFDTIYYQRPLKKPKVATCKYEKNRKVIHASNPHYQSFRILRDVLNISIYDLEKNEVEIPFHIRMAWFKKCNNGQNITKASCLKDLGLKHPTHYSWYSGKVIAGNPVRKLFVDLKINSENVVELWQDIYSATDNEKLGALLERKYQFDEYTINELLDADFTKLGWSDFSMKAINKLTPQMFEGKKLKHAILDVYGKVDFNEVALRNVVLEQHFESAKSLINALKERYDIVESQFEIDHLLKQGNKGRKAIAQNKRKEEKFAKEHSDLSHYNQIKLKLWEESKGISPYEPDVIIPLEELFTDKYNLDHIIPKSKIYERSLSNQVLCPKVLNEKKNRKTGIEFAQELGIMDSYLKAIANFPESKQSFLSMYESDIPDNHLSKRQNNDYNTKCFSTIAGINIPNKLINRYLKEWKHDQYTEQDARHYLCKAWVMANMSQETVHYFDDIKHHTIDRTSVSVYNIQPDLLPINLDDVIVYMPRVKFTRKTKYGYTPRFALHQESVFGRRVSKKRNAKGQLVEEVFFKIRQPISKLTPAMVLKIMDKAIREKVQKRIEEKRSHEDGILSMAENPIYHNHKPIKRISIAQPAEKIYALHSTDGKGITGAFKDFEQKIDYVFSDKAYLLEVSIDEKGKVSKKDLPLMAHVNNLNQGCAVKPKFYLQANDIVVLHQKFWFVIGASESLTLRPVTTLSATDSYHCKVNDYPNMVKVVLNQLGEYVDYEYTSMANER